MPCNQTQSGRMRRLAEKAPVYFVYLQDDSGWLRISKMFDIRTKGDRARGCDKDKYSQACIDVKSIGSKGSTWLSFQNYIPAVTKGCDPWRLGVPRTSTHWMGRATPSCDSWYTWLVGVTRPFVLHVQRERHASVCLRICLVAA